MLEAPNAVEHRFAFDLDVVRGFLRIMSGGEVSHRSRDVEDLAALRLYAYVGSPRIVPTIRDELETAAQPPLSQWKHYGSSKSSRTSFSKARSRAGRNAISRCIQTRAIVASLLKPSTLASTYF